MNDKEYKEYIKTRIEGYREVLRGSSLFSCACCGQTKPKGEAAGIHVYQPKTADLKKAMKTPEGPKVATYVLCLECVDSFPDSVIHAKVTAFLSKQGLFG